MTPESPLLRLPGELRNTIYEFIILDTQPIRLGSKLTPQTPLRECFISSSPMTLACHQTHEECRDSLEKVAMLPKFWDARVETSVTNFNFDQVATYITKLSKDDIEALNIASKLYIKSTFSDPNELPDLVHTSLVPWTEYCTIFAIKAAYEVDDTAYGGRSYAPNDAVIATLPVLQAACRTGPF